LPKSAGLSSKTGLYEDRWQKIQGLSSKRAGFADGLPKISVPSSKTALYEDGWQKTYGVVLGRRALGYKGYKRHKRARDFAGCVGRN